VDASAAAKESSLRLKAAAGNGASSSPLPSARVRLFIDGEAADDAEGDIGCLMPLPVIDDRLDSQEGSSPSSAALTTDFLVLAPGFVGRLGEVRLWSKKKTSDEISEAKDFHLDMAESKRGKMTIQIRAAAAATVPTTPGLPINTSTSDGVNTQTNLPSSTAAAAASVSSSAATTAASTASVSSSALPLPPTIKKLGAPLGGLGGGGGGGGLAAPPSGVSSKRKTATASSASSATAAAAVTSSSAATPTESSVKNASAQGFDDDFASGFSSSTTSSSSTEATIIDQQHSSSISQQSGTISNSDADFETTPAPLKKPFGGLSKPGGGLAAPPPPAASSKKKAMMAKAKTAEEPRG
jgi:hypothetical protein